MKLLRSLPFLIVAMLAGGLSAVACGASAADPGIDGDGSGDGPSAAAGAGTGGAPGGDGSIDVSNDAEPVPGPTGYGHLCQSGELRKDECVPVAGADPCIDENTEDGGSTAPVLSSCALSPDGEGGAVGTCDAQGTGAYADPCQTARDCTAGMGCVPAVTADPDEVVGACRDYCCGDVETCPKNTFCAPQPMAEATSVEIPVCVPATNCKLLEPCGEGLACTVVRADGTTSCVPAGDGHQGDACPCAAGFMCAKLTNECKKLCHEGASEDCPAGMVCQGGSMEFPDGFGVCVASSSYN